MKMIGRSALFALSVIVCVVGTADAVNGATATVTLLPGKLTITDAPAVLNFASTTATDDVRTYLATFSISVTDATGSLAGWHIQAALGPFLGTTGTSALASTSVITGANVTTQSGRAPNNTLIYPRPFRTDGDTIFSAAPRSGMGRSSVAFATQVSFPTMIADSEQYTTALDVTVISGP